MQAVINNVRYRVADSTLLAHDSYWDGRNFERHGRNRFLYRSPGGWYFVVCLTTWEPERNCIDALWEEAAYELYHDLPVHELEVEEAFPDVVEPA